MGQGAAGHGASKTGLGRSKCQRYARRSRERLGSIMAIGAALEALDQLARIRGPRAGLLCQAVEHDALQVMSDHPAHDL